MARKGKMTAPPEGVRAVEDIVATPAAKAVPSNRPMTKGVSIKLESGMIVIRIPYDKTKEYPINESGKSRMVGSTGGWVKDPFNADGALSVTAAAIRVIPKAERKK